MQQAAEAGGLRICVTCAGIGTPGRLVGRDGPTALDRFNQVNQVNLVGTVNVLRVAAGAMVGNAPDDGGERGVCVNTASIAAFDGQVGQIAYAASKGGVVGLTFWRRASSRARACGCSRWPPASSRRR